MTDRIKIKYWWSEDKKWFCILTDDGNCQSTVSLTVEEASLLSMNAVLDPGNAQSPARTLVDWTYLYTTAGEAWPDAATISDPLIKLARRPPTQEDADRLKAGASLKELLSPPSNQGASK